MKRFAIILLSGFMMIFSVFCEESKEESEFDKIMSHIYFPSDFGLAIPTNSNIKPGITGKTSVEWRFKPLQSVFCIFEYNDTSFDYSDLQAEGSNLLSGSVNYSDFLLGAGYRFNFAENWCTAFSLMGGISNCTYGTIVKDGSYYQTDSISKWIPAVKANLMLEYYFDPAFGIYISAGYKQYLKNTVYTSGLSKEGNAEFSIGMTSTLW